MNPEDEITSGRQLWTGYLVAPVERTSSSIAVRELLVRVLRAWRVWLITGFIGGLVGVGLAFLITPIYRCAAVVSIDTQSVDPVGSGLLGGQLTGLAGLAGLSLGGNNRRMEFIAVLESRSLADQFISENNLIYDFFADRWDAKAKRWTSKRPPSKEDAYRFFAERIRGVDEDRRTGLITVSMEWRDRFAAARWANLYVQRANELARARAMQEANSSLEFLDRELAKASTVEIRAAMYALMEAQKKHQMLATVRREYIFHIVDPAVVPDEDRYVKPKRPLMALACAFAGGILGLMFALYRARSQRANDKK
jgi:uncharacterized protein involved in exopolysaccharide biosynthesis